MKTLMENERALLILKSKGELPLAVLARELNITTEGARFNLLKLAKEGLVQNTSKSKGRGRPQQIWSLTEAGHERFPDAHADLTVRLIQQMKDTLGEEALDAVIMANGNENVARYSKVMNINDQLEQRVAKLAEMRNIEGYMATYKKDDNKYLLIENHCPICAAAATCQGFCRSELETFKTVLGENVKIERVDHILSGARRCAYEISGLE
ncbi:helix-turn-helix transcriptional regulator [Leeuwenhoekiella sp. A16]|uniref:helix-turn-helix transcriptional regulator n=1 Tax=unclassified Leeuwenhoekiella TaxID=2615029 RepID=UPI003A805DA0